MKAVRIHEHGGPERLVYDDVERPRPAAGQVLVRIAAAAVNPVDVAVREGAFPTPLSLPKTLGSDGAGTVEALGDDVSGVAIGDEVFFTGLGIGMQGSYAEYALIAETMAVPRPSTLALTESASLGLAFATAYYGLVGRADLRADETVLVQGAAGGVGSAAVQLAATLGARVLATVGDEDEGAFVRDLGADAQIDRHGDVTTAVKELTEGKGVDVVVELHVSANLATDLAVIAKGGRIVGIGQGPRPVVEVPIGQAIGNDASLLFTNSGNAGRAGTAAILREVAGLVDQGKLRPVIGASFPLSEARAAHEALAQRHLGKIVLLP